MADAIQLMEAVKTGNAAEVERLLHEAPELAQARAPQGISIAQFAAYVGQAPLGLRIAKGRPRDVFEAAALGDLDALAQRLSEETQLTRAVSPDGFSALGLACFFGHRALAEKLLAAGADPKAASQNAMRVAPLHSAVSRGDEAIARLLLDRGADANARQMQGVATLHQAAANGNAALIQLLREHGADPEARTDDGKSPADFARERGHPEVVPLLGS